jgi:glyoxylate reductase
MARVFVTRAVPGEALERLRRAHDVRVWDGALPPEPAVLREALAEVEGLLCLLTERVDAALLDAAPRLRAIANYAVGTDNIDLELTRARGIPVGVTPDVLTEATADLAFALLLAAARGLPQAAADARAGAWRTWEPARWLGAEVDGASLGIIGFGRIGRALARRAVGFRMSVRTSADTELDELLAQSDFVSLHVPLNARTRHLIDAAALKRMRSNAILVNTARGAVVDQRALIEALRNGDIAGAAIDVTDPEPPPVGDPIYDVPNLLVVPHIGSATRAARARMTELAVGNLLAGLEGRPMPHPAG